MTAARAPLPGGERALAARWLAGLGGPLRLADGRRLAVVFPGIPGGGAGPDVRAAILEIDGGLVHGDVELHLAASGWRAHGHHRDPAYGQVVLHVVALNDTGAAFTGHASGRAIPVLAAGGLAAGAEAFPPPFAPPCTLARARGLPVAPTLERMGLRRLRVKAVRVAPLVAAAGPACALQHELLRVLGGPANGQAFATLAERLPLAALLERANAAAPGAPWALCLAAEIRAAASAGSCFVQAGARPAARPAARVEAAAALIGRLWPRGAAATWPPALAPGAALVPLLRAPGCGRATAIELAVNAVLPVMLAGGVWPEAAVEAAWAALPSPGTYGLLRPLARWLGPGGGPPFASAGTLQGGLLLHADYCSRGRCGRCPLSD